jgi:hypothetical protein
MYPEGLSATEFRRPFMYYTLFTTIAHCVFGLPGLDAPRVNLAIGTAFQAARERFDVIDELFLGGRELSVAERQFLTDSQRATTDQSVRERRTNFLINLLVA